MPSNILIKAALTALVLSTAVPLAACDDQGPAEQVGERIDEGVNDTQRAIEDATD
ncbi:MAG: hypothetical protein ACK4NA_12460 [Alphaproteobacteria bacterium]